MSESQEFCRIPVKQIIPLMSLVGVGIGIQPLYSAGGGGLLLRSCFCMKEMLPNKHHGDKSRGSGRLKYLAKIIYYCTWLPNYVNKKIGTK